MIRPATAADAHAVSSLVQRAYAPWEVRIGRKPLPMLADYAALIAAGGVCVLAAESRIAAVLVLEQQSGALLIENVAVDPVQQRRGHGRALMRHAEDQATRLGIAVLRLYTNVLMTDNIAFYERLGYTQTHCSDDDGRRRVFMEKRVPP